MSVPITDLGSSVFALVNVVAKGMEEELDPFDLQPLEFSLLRFCLGSEWTTSRDLVKVLPVDSSRISRVVEKMRARGLLSRRRHPDDRRVVRLRLTEDGRNLAMELSLRVQTRESKLMEGVSEAERNAFLSVTGKILSNYSTDG